MFVIILSFLIVSKFYTSPTPKHFFCMFQINTDIFRLELISLSRENLILAAAVAKKIYFWSVFLREAASGQSTNAFTPPPLASAQWQQYFFFLLLFFVLCRKRILTIFCFHNFQYKSHIFRPIFQKKVVILPTGNKIYMIFQRLPIKKKH